MYDKLSLGLIYTNANELTILSYNPKNKTFSAVSSFLFSQYDATLKKLNEHIVAVRTRLRNTITFYSIVDAEALLDNINKHVL